MTGTTALAPMLETVALPASSGQQRFWVLDRLKPGDPTLNVAVRFGLSGPLDPATMARALNETVRRHEILRAKFAMVDEQVMQIVAPTFALPLEVTDLRSCPASRLTAEADRLAEQEARLPFNLAEGPLLRARLLGLADEEHILLITIHHIICDGWSIGILTDELGPLYEAFLENKPSPLPELEIQYADYAIWERENRDEKEWSDAEAYWRQQINNLPRFEVMPDKPRGGTAIGNIVSRLLPRDLTDRLRVVSREYEATLFMTMLTGLVILLHRYTSETDVVVGSQVVGRNVVDVEPLIGPFINTLVLRTDASGDPSFVELLSRVSRVVSDALTYQFFPLDKVVESLRVERTADRNALFEVNFIYQRDFVQPWNYGGIRMRPIPSKSPGAFYDLNIFLVERADGWRMSCEYNTSLYYEATILQLLEHFERLLYAIMQDPSLPISRFRFLDPSEENRMLADWNRTTASFPAGTPTHRLFEEQVERSPSAEAVRCAGVAANYGELNRRANQLARCLMERGVTRGDLVGVGMERSIDMLVSVLAVMKAGAAYVPLDPSFPADRLRFMTQDADLRLLIDEAFLRSVQGSLDAGDASDLAVPVTGDDLAYVIYTSGSTGNPKGVGIHHRALVNLLWAILDKPGICATDSLLAVTTLSFDIAGLELFAPLLAGARIVLATKAQASDPMALRKLLITSEANILQATPATWRMLIDAGWHGTPSLKMLCGGEPMSRELADAMLERGGELWNLYGPTETTIWSSWCQILPDGEPISIGRPAPNQAFYVLDGQLRPVPVGVPGELCIGGEGVAQGYRNRPELTAAKFLHNPFAPGRLYRTGDRARFRHDGRVEVLGRMDSQVKIRGFRIELGEVEAALAGCPLVKTAAVVVRQDAGGQNVLAGYFVASDGEGSSPEAIRDALRQRLPDYMVPTFLIPMSVLPQTPNGKLNRKALPAPEPSARVELSERPAPADALESTLVGIWEQVLNVRPVGRNDNFFEIGGHSVLAARMFARMEKVLGQSLPLATLFQGPTVAKLAALMRDGGWTPPWRSLVPIRPSGTQLPFFFVHPIGGNVLNFAGFASHFDTDQPVYGLQARGLDGKEAPNTSIYQMAADYISEIRTIQPHGPYHVGGFSAGGIVAFEMARQLKATGETIKVLALLDTRAQGSKDGVELTGRPMERIARTIRFNLRYPFQVGLLAFCVRKLKNWRMQMHIHQWLLRKSFGLNPGHVDAEEAFLLALRDYEPEPYSGDAILFRARDELVRYPDPNLGWTGLVEGKLEIQEISGDHDTLLLEPHIGMLARVLNNCLRNR